MSSSFWIVKKKIENQQGYLAVPQLKLASNANLQIYRILKWKQSL